MVLMLGWVAVMAAGGTWWVRRDVATYAWFEAPWRTRTMARRAFSPPWPPIRPEHVFLYPIDWPQLSQHVRFGRAKGRCEHCARPHGQRVFHLGDGRWWDRSRLCWRNGRDDACAAPWRIFS